MGSGEHQKRPFCFKEFVLTTLSNYRASPRSLDLLCFVSKAEYRPPKVNCLDRAHVKFSRVLSRSPQSTLWKQRGVWTQIKSITNELGQKSLDGQMSCPDLSKFRRIQNASFKSTQHTASHSASGPIVRTDDVRR